jgi:Domain of unknown function (DU1801)
MMMSEPKTKASNQNVKDYIMRVEDPIKREDCLKLLELMRQLTQAEPQMWGTSIIGFDRYQYKYASGKVGEWPIVGFSPRKQNLTLYIMPGFAQYEDLLKKLGKHKLGKSCLYIKRLEDVDWATLKELVSFSVEYMRRTYATDPDGADKENIV